MFKPGAVQRPELAIGAIVKHEPLGAVENRNAGRQLIERARMRFHLPAKIGAHALQLGLIDRYGDRAARRGRLHNVEHAALASHDGGRTHAPDLSTSARLSGCLAGVCLQQFSPARHGFARIRRLHGAGIGGVDPDNPALPVAHPRGAGHCVEQGAERIRLHQRACVTLAQLRQLQPVAGDIANAQHGAACNGAAIGLNVSPRNGEQRQAKAFAALAQSLDAGLELGRKIGRKPGAERQHAARGRGLQHQRDVAGNVRFVAGGPPRDHDLLFDRQKGAGPIKRSTRRR